MSELVPVGPLARVFQLSPETLLERWTQRGSIAVYREGLNKPHFKTADTDALLANGAMLGFATPPTADDLLSGRIKLLTPKQAGRELGIKPGSVGSLARQGEIEAVRIGRAALRISARSVAARKAIGKGRLTFQQVAHILDLTDTRLNALIHQGRLTTVSVRKKLYVTLGSLLNPLVDSLPSWIPPEVWIAQRLASESGFLALKQLCYSRQDYPRLYALLRQGKLPYILSVTGGKRLLPRVPADMSLAYCQEYEKQVSNGDWALLFGVDITTVTRWDTEFPGWRTCNLHPHTDQVRYTTCAVKILERYVSKHPLRWLQQRLAGSVALCEADVLQKLAIDEPKMLHDLVETYKIMELRTPDNGRRYSPSSMRFLKAKMREAARSE